MDERLMKQGAFGWFELMTSDVQAARKFYTQLLGWTTSDMPMPGFTYTVINLDGEGIGGIMTMPPDAGEMPPVWGMYITVKDIEATVKKARDLGGKILVEPQDVPEVGRFSVIQDPQGAWFSVMQYKN